MRRIRITEDTPWILSAYESEPVERAVQDLSNDWYMVFGSKPLVYDALPEGYTGSVIYIGQTARQHIQVSEDRESFTAMARDGDLYLAGAEELGTIYALYTFSEQVLGVDPWYFWNDFLPEKKELIELEADFDISHGSPSFKYRGFFINNEDMVSGSFPDPLKETFLDLTVFNKICELILRLHGNIIAPGTRPYPDEAVRAVAARRGLYINDHHVTPLGLNVYMWPPELPYSYVTHPEILEEMWEKCIEEEKQYKMFWTVSFRGKGDGPFWHVDPAAPESDEARADVINRAVAKQVEMIRRVQPEADIMFNMYYEQAELCKKGLLKIPQGVIRVWPNDGAGTMSDGGEVAAGDGAYFHITACRNRFSEAVSPEQIYTELGRYKKVGADGCLIMNVGNIRHFPVSIRTVMDFVYDSEPYLHTPPKEAMERSIEDYCRKHYGACAKETAQLYTKLFRCSNFRKPRPDMPPYGYGGECLGMYKEMWYASYNQVLTDFRQSLYMHEIARRYIKVLKGECDFSEIWEKTVDDFNSVVHEETAYLPELSRRAHALEQYIPQRSLNLYRENLMLQIDTVNLLNLSMENEGLSLKAYMHGDTDLAKHYMKAAIAAIKQMLDVFHSVESVKWPVWYKNEALSCFWHTRDLMRCVLSLLEGEGEILIRPFIDFTAHGKQIYYYQYRKENFGNFPFLKGPTKG